MLRPLIVILLIVLFSCDHAGHKEAKVISPQNKARGVSLVLLGTLQDGGSPHIGCQKKCCERLFSNPDKTRRVVSIGVLDPQNNSNYLIEATPDLSWQLRALKDHSPFKDSDIPEGIFLTHAHMGHYAGLMYLGKEAMNANCVKVYTMPRMKSYLEKNGPWSQLVNLNNILLLPIEDQEEIKLSSSLKIIPFHVPHRDEYSETVGYKIEGPHKKVLFIPDIDKWSKWDKSIIEEIKKVDYAFIDGTFFDGTEINNRNISEIPHPFVIESMELFKSLPPAEKDKIYFIHFNHTCPLLDTNSKQAKRVLQRGFHLSVYDAVFPL
jgi:pyrroloquinoline quinone biosynthesis protein B